MDYSLLVGIHNVDQACQEQANEDEGAGAKGQVQKALYSTAIEAIQAEVGRMGSMETEDRWVTECLWSYRAGLSHQFLSEKNYRRLKVFLFAEREESLHETWKARGCWCTSVLLTFFSLIGNNSLYCPHWAHITKEAHEQESSSFRLCLFRMRSGTVSSVKPRYTVSLANLMFYTKGQSGQ